MIEDLQKGIPECSRSVHANSGSSDSAAQIQEIAEQGREQVKPIHDRHGLDHP
jgi:hypothetical protein